MIRLPVTLVKYQDSIFQCRSVYRDRFEEFLRRGSFIRDEMVLDYILESFIPLNDQRLVSPPNLLSFQ